MLNKRIVSAVAAAAVALGGFGAPVFGGFAQNFDIAASAYAYDYPTFRQYCLDAGATDRMIEELDKFFSENLDYFTADCYVDFMKGVDKLYDQVMVPRADEKYGKTPAQLTNEERKAIIAEMGTQNQMKCYDLIRQVANKHGVEVAAGRDEEGTLIPVCSLIPDFVKPEKVTVKVKAIDKEGTPDYTEGIVAILDANEELKYVQNPEEDGSVDLTGLLKDGYTIFTFIPGYAPRKQAFDSAAGVDTLTVAKYGDLDGDGDVDLDDLIFMQKLVAGWNVNPIYDEVANVNGKGEVDIDDLVLMQKYVAGWNVKLAGDAAEDLQPSDE